MSTNLKKNPWEVLGIPRNSSIDDIKAQYRRLALSLHPDKHNANLSEEERKQREDQFKEVSVAYQVAMSMADTPNRNTEWQDSEKWRHIWERVECIMRNHDFMRGTIKDILNIAVNRMAYAGSVPLHNVYSTSSSCSDSEDESEPSLKKQMDDIPRIFKLTVTMEEVHSKKSRRVRLFLKEHSKDPFYEDVDFDMFPEMVCYHTHGDRIYKIIIEMEIKKSHPVYYWDNLLGGWDLYTSVPITLSEYFTGCKRFLPGIGSSPVITIEIPAFPDMKKSIIITGMGLRERGNLYAVLEICLPMKNDVEMAHKKDPIILEKFLNICKIIEKPNASHDVSS